MRAYCIWGQLCANQRRLCQRNVMGVTRQRVLKASTNCITLLAQLAWRMQPSIQEAIHVLKQLAIIVFSVL